MLTKEISFKDSYIPIIKYSSILSFFIKSKLTLIKSTNKLRIIMSNRYRLLCTINRCISIDLLIIESRIERSCIANIFLKHLILLILFRIIHKDGWSFDIRVCNDLSIRLKFNRRSSYLNFVIVGFISLQEKIIDSIFKRKETTISIVIQNLTNLNNQIHACNIILIQFFFIKNSQSFISTILNEFWINPRNVSIEELI